MILTGGMIVSTNILDQARRAYQDGRGGVIPAPADIPANKTPMELASLGYSQEARHKETKKTPAEKPLWNIIRLIDGGSLPESLRLLAENPPAREDMRYLPREIQTLVSELTTLNKAIDSLPEIESGVQSLRKQKDSWTGEAIRTGVTDRGANVNGLTYPHSLEGEEKILFKIASEKNEIIKGAKAYADNNPQIMEQSNAMLNTLRRQLQAPQPYSEAKSGIPVKRKTARMWLDDVGNKPSLDDRIEAQKVLEEAGIDHRAILTEVERQGLSLTDRKIMEMRDAEAGLPQAPKPSSDREAGKPIAESTQTGGE